MTTPHTQTHQIDTTDEYQISQAHENVKRAIGYLMETAHENSVNHGFYDTDDDIVTSIFHAHMNDRTHEDQKTKDQKHNINCVLTRLMLITTELAEGAEYYRKGNPSSDHLPQFDGLSEELADAVIRICDLAAWLDLPLGEVVIAKMEFNAGREKMHGKLV